MVQVLQLGKQKPGTTEKINQGIDTGMKMLAEYSQQKKQSQQTQAENEAIKKLTGYDASGIQDPKMRQEILAQALQGQREKQNFESKQGGSFARQILGLGAEQNATSLMGGMGAGRPNEMIGGLGASRPQQMMTGAGPSQPGQMVGGAGAQSKSPMSFLESQPESKLRQLASLSGQPGEDGIIGNAAKGILEQKEKKSGREFEREKISRKEEGEISKPILLELNQSRKNIPLQEQAIQDIKEAAPNVNSLDYFADLTGFEPLRTAQGVKLKTAIKDFFLSDLTRVGARPNQWIEQQLADALPKIGRSTEANLITAEGLQFKVDLAKKRIETIDKLAEQDRKKHGYVKGDIDSRADNEMKKYVIDRQKELQSKIKTIKTAQKGAKDIVKVKAPDGSIYEISPKDLEEAMSHGYESIQ